MCTGVPCPLPSDTRPIGHMSHRSLRAMCRVAAVNGAVYVLRQPIHSLLLDPETKQCKGIQTDAGQVSLPYLLNLPFFAVYISQ